jgi:hypothetical protein
LLIKLLDQGLAWPNLAFELFNLVVKHKFEFFELLSFLVQISNLAVLVPNRGLALCQFIDLTLKLGFFGVKLVNFIL